MRGRTRVTAVARSGNNLDPSYLNPIIFYRAVEHAIVERASAELTKLESTTDSSASQKRRFLTEIVERSGQPTLGL